jgi:DNA-binding XRE family transcriptional regulator
MMKTVGKPLGYKLISNPMTIGKKIKNRRLELGLFQKDVAKAIGVSDDSIRFWEKNRSVPQVCHYPKIIQFLGYIPFDVDISTFGGKIKLYRYCKGLTQEKLALKLNINESTVFSYENNKHKPTGETMRKLDVLINH